VIAEKSANFGQPVLGVSISGAIFEEFSRRSANECGGSNKATIAAGPDRPAEISLCIVNAAQPEICTVP
jgi:hypothetical protein